MPSENLRQLLNDAVVHHRAGRFDQAEAIYRKILTFEPNHVDGLHLLGVVATQRGRPTEAVELIGRAIALSKKPVAEFYNNIGAAFRALGRPDDAAEQFDRAVALKPDYAEAHANLGAVLKDRGRLDKAAACCRQAVALKPDAPKGHYALGAVLQEQGKLDEAASCYERALALRSDYAEARNNLGVVLKDMGRLDEAAAHLERAIAIDPAYAEVEYNLGIVRQERGQPREAVEHFRRAQALKPDYADAHFNESLVRLSLGEFAAGWREYEWRWRRPEYPPRRFAQPAWDGGDLGGQTILLYAEQGFGDNFQFIRYARPVKERGATVIVECLPGLPRLLDSCLGIDRLIARGEPLPPFDCHAPFPSLPGLLGTALETIPDRVPYLRVEPDLAAAWRGRAIRRPAINVGLAWRGNPKNTHDRRRSLDADAIADIGAIPGINWISLQADARPEEIAALSPLGAVQDYGPLLTGWEETAALISELDLVIAVDTAVAHLAGALGKPAWILLSFAPHWVWLLDREDSPWYPTLRLFRQPAAGDWVSVLRRVQAELACLSPMDRLREPQ